MAAYLLIVAPDRPGLWDYWTRRFEGLHGVQVLADRRQCERRQTSRGHEPERRRTDRRRRTWIDHVIRSSGFTLIPLAADMGQKSGPRGEEAK